MSDDLRIYNPHLSTPHLLYIVFYQNKEIVLLRLRWGILLEIIDLQKVLHVIIYLSTICFDVITCVIKTIKTM